MLVKTSLLACLLWHHVSDVVDCKGIICKSQIVLFFHLLF